MLGGPAMAGFGERRARRSGIRAAGGPLRCQARGGPPSTKAPRRRSNSWCSGPRPPPTRKSPTSMSLVLPPEEAFGSCLTNTRPEPGARMRDHRSPSAMRYSSLFSRGVLPGAPALCRASRLPDTWRERLRCATSRGRVAPSSGAVLRMRRGGRSGDRGGDDGRRRGHVRARRGPGGGHVTFRASVPPRVAVAMLSTAAVGLLLALLHWGRWLPW